MLKEIIKRDGSTEPFQPSKVNSWSIWASEQLGNRVDWASVVMEAMSHFKDKATSQELQKQLIKICVQKKSWPYNLMAGRLYAAMTRKEIYDNINPPTIYEVHKNLQTLGLMKKLDYTEQEYEDIEKFIDHSRDFEYAFSQVQQLRKKYAIRNRVNKQEYESPQFVFMRMAMALAETEPKENRLKHIVNWYNHFSFNRINAPSPNYINLGTRLNGYASCFPAGSLVTTKDGYKNIENIQVGEEVITHLNNLKKVYHIQNKEYSGKFVRINSVATFNDEIKPTEEHRLYGIKCVSSNFIKEKDQKIQREWIRADNFRVGDYIKLSYDNRITEEDASVWDIVGPTLEKEGFMLEDGFIKKPLKYDEGGKKQQPDIANASIYNNDLFRLFGYYLSQGCYVKPKDRKGHLSLTFGIKRITDSEDAVRILTNFGARTTVEFREDNSISVQTYSRVLSVLCLELFNTGFDKKLIPEKIMTAKPEHQLHLLAGVIKGDGTAIISGFQILLHNKPLITQLRDIALRLKLSLRVSHRENFKGGFDFLVPCSATLVINVPGNSELSSIVNKDLQKIRTEISSQGANVLYLEDGAYARVRRLSSYEDTCTVYDLSVEGDASFSVGGLAVHNCCVYKSDDQVDSLAIGDHIAYKMTAMSAGIGGMISTRTLGDPVRSGVISHAGKLPYYRALAFATRANQQAGRGGACTTYYSAYDPENITIAALQNPTTTVDKRIRELHFAVLFNRLFTKKAAKNEEVFVFTEYSAPDLWQAMFSGDQDAFEKLYQEYEDNEYFKKNYVNAREFVIYARQQAFECGTHYEMWIDEANRHTPFKDPIHSSNLCVAGNTKIRTDKGEVDIKSKVNQMVNVWNGEEWSKVTVRKTGENKKLYRVWTWDNKYLDCTAEHRWYIQGRDDYVETKDLPTGSKTVEWKDPDTGEIKSSIITVKQPLEGLHDTYCFTEPKRHMGVFNDILTGQCVEIMLPTAGYTSIMDLYSGDDHGKGEIAICALAGLVVCNIHTEEQYESAAYYALKMIDKCIDMSDYPFEHVKLTARSRRSAGVGILGLATSLARKKLKYSSQEGKDYCHEVAEKHYYYLLKASLKLGKELGNAPWIHKTKWPEGWLPIDTYKKTVDTITAPKYNYDWETIRKEVIANGGIRNSVLVAHMPTESSSKAAGAPNCIYPIRELSLKKSDNSNIVDWVAMDSDLLENDYELSWDIPTMDMIKVYAIFQKFTDQGISADLWQDRATDPNVYTDQIIEEHIAMCRYGIKSRYYQNSLTSDQGKDSSNMTLKTDLSKLGINLSKQSTAEVEAETDSNSDSIFEAMSESDRGCAGGACSL